MDKKKGKIVVIDDDPDMVETLRLTLEHASYDVVGVLNGREGIDAVAQHEPDLVILDLIMPEMDGFAVCKELKTDERYGKIPLIVLSAIGEERSHKEYAEKMGCGLTSDCFLTKPVDPDILLNTIGTFI